MRLGFAVQLGTVLFLNTFPKTPQTCRGRRRRPRPATRHPDLDCVALYYESRIRRPQLDGGMAVT
jgi:hypothetical protein